MPVRRQREDVRPSSKTHLARNLKCKVRAHFLVSERNTGWCRGECVPPTVPHILPQGKQPVNGRGKTSNSVPKINFMQSQEAFRSFLRPSAGKLKQSEPPERAGIQENPSGVRENPLSGCLRDTNEVTLWPQCQMCKDSGTPTKAPVYLQWQLNLWILRRGQETITQNITINIWIQLAPGSHWQNKNCEDSHDGRGVEEMKRGVKEC